MVFLQDRSRSKPPSSKRFFFLDTRCRAKPNIEKMKDERNERKKKKERKESEERKER